MSTLEARAVREVRYRVPDKLSFSEYPTKFPQSWIEKSSGVCGGDARIRRTRYTVWGLVEWRNLGLSDAQILERHPDLSPEDLQAAWSYYRDHREEIDRTIRENQEA
jgi:uncharacterized protein (DUF433 family)